MKKMLLLILVTSMNAAAKIGQEVLCKNGLEDHDFVISGVLADGEMNLTVVDNRNVLVLPEGGKVLFKKVDIDSTDFKSGVVFEGQTGDHMLLLNLPKRAMTQKIKKPVKAKFETYFEGFRLSYSATLYCEVAPNT